MRPAALALFFSLPLLLYGSAQAGGLGRLFFTPQQRAQLEADHTRNTTAEDGAPTMLTVNGIVQKHGGARTIWINGVAQNADNGSGGNPETEPVSVPGISLPVAIKVGQKLLLDKTAPQKQASSSE